MPLGRTIVLLDTSSKGMCSRNSFDCFLASSRVGCGGIRKSFIKEAESAIMIM